jgi:hypothetical protein
MQLKTLREKITAITQYSLPGGIPLWRGTAIGMAAFALTAALLVVLSMRRPSMPAMNTAASPAVTGSAISGGTEGAPGTASQRDLASVKTDTAAVAGSMDMEAQISHLAQSELIDNRIVAFHVRKIAVVMMLMANCNNVGFHILRSITDLVPVRIEKYSGSVFECDFKTRVSQPINSHSYHLSSV